LVIVPEKSNYDCQYCYKPFPNGLTLRGELIILTALPSERPSIDYFMMFSL